MNINIRRFKMYITRQEESLRNLIKFPCLVVIGIFLFALLGLCVALPLNALGFRPWWLIALINAIICYRLRDQILSRITRTVPENSRLLTYNPFWPSDLPEIIITKKDKDGNDIEVVVDKGKQTDPNEYGPGFHFVWPWEKDIEVVSLKTDISEEIADQELSSIRGDTPKMKVQFDVEPDPTRCAYYILNGENETERKKNIKERLKALIQGELESFFGSIIRLEGATDHGVDIDQLFTSLAEIKEKLNKHFHDDGSSLKNECHVMGVRLKKVRIGDINRSEDNAKSIRVEAASKKYEDAAYSIKDRLGVSPETAMASALAVGDEIEGKGVIIGIPEKSTGDIAEAVMKIIQAMQNKGG